jgi:hypothetical protein
VAPYAGEDPDGEAKRRALEDHFSTDREPQRQLNEEQLTALRAEMKRAAGARAAARHLKELPEGRYPITYSAGLYDRRLAQRLQDALTVAILLHYDAWLRVQEGDADGALESCRAILNCGRSIGDEPLLGSQSLRRICRSFAVKWAQRALAQGEPSDAALRQLQELLEKEEAEAYLLQALRGERARTDQLFDALQTGKIKTTARDLVKEARGDDLPPDEQPTLLEMVSLSSAIVLKMQRAAMLRYMTQAVEIAKLPPEQQYARFEELKATRKDQPLLVRVLTRDLSGASRLLLGHRLTHTLLRCAAVAVAAERYRRDKGHWPNTLAVLQETGYLRAVPADLFDGRPLRWRRLDDGAVVYSVGPDGQDNGGKLDLTNPEAPGTDLGFRLWDVDRRRQPAPAADGAEPRRGGGR